MYQGNLYLIQEDKDSNNQDSKEDGDNQVSNSKEVGDSSKEVNKEGGDNQDNKEVWDSETDGEEATITICR